MQFDVRVVEDGRLPLDAWMLIESSNGAVELVMRRSAVGNAAVLEECRAALQRMRATQAPRPRIRLDPPAVVA